MSHSGKYWQKAIEVYFDSEWDDRKGKYHANNVSGGTGGSIDSGGKGGYSKAGGYGGDLSLV